MKLVEPATDLDAYLTLEYLASEPYTTFVFETPAEAKATARFYVDTGVSEIAPPHGALAIDDGGRSIGMLAFAAGEDLKRARMAAAMAMVRGKRIDARGPVRERMLLAGDTLIDVGADDLYLSRIAVAESARGGGVAAWLMTQYEAAGRARGAKRLVLEVWPGHSAALRMYQRAGFVELSRQRSVDPATQRDLVYLHLGKGL